MENTFKNCEFNQSDDPGWTDASNIIDKLINKVKLLPDQQWNVFVDKFKHTQSEQCLKYCLNNTSLIKMMNQFYDEITSQHQVHEKCLEKAKEFRVKGNEFFKNKNYQQAIQFYSFSICSVPISHSKIDCLNELSLSFGNRSAAQFHLKQYAKSLLDIEDALSHNYPDHLQHKIVIRKALCLSNCNKKEEAISLLNEMLNNLSDSKLEKEIRDTLSTISKINISTEVCSNSIKKQSLEECNPLMPCASKNVDFKFTEKKGRHIVAKDDFQVKDVVMIERPYVACLYVNHFEKYCQNCFTLLEGRVIPCNHCDQIRYCSDQCKTKAWTEFHHFECNSLLNFAKDLGIFYIIIRIIGKIGVENVLKIMDKQDLNENQDGKYLNNYQSVYQLLNHFNHRNTEELAAYTLAAAFILITFLRNNILNELNQEQINNLGCIILKHLLQLSTNSISILEQSDLKIEDFSINGISQNQVEIGVGIYPTVSLLNHSCVPNVFTIFNGSLLTVIALRRIKSGDEINYCYGPSFNSMTRKDRQTKLKQQYFFECECSGCLSGEENKKRALVCPKCKGPVICNNDNTNKCLDCKSSDLDVVNTFLQIEKANELMGSGQQYANANDHTTAYIHLMRASDVLNSTLYSQHEKLFEINGHLCVCLAMLSHYDKAIEYCNKRIDFCRENFGEFSYELMQELIKLFSLKVNYIDDDDTSESERKATWKNMIEIYNNIDSIIEKLSCSSDKLKNAFKEEQNYLNEKMQTLSRSFKI